MRNIRFTFLAIIMMCCLPQCILAQIDPRFREDLNAMVKRTASEGLKTTILYKVYNAQMPDKLIDQTQMQYMVKGNNFYLDNKQTTIYSNEDFSVVKVKDDKRLIIQKAGSGKLKNAQFAMPDSEMFNAVERITVLKDSAGIRTYEVLFKNDGPFKSWKLTLNTTEHYLVENIITYRMHMNDMYGTETFGKDNDIIPMVVVQFTQCATPDKQELQLCRAGEIGVITARKLELSPAYKSYKVNNYLNYN